MARTITPEQKRKIKRAGNGVGRDMLMFAGYLATQHGKFVFTDGLFKDEPWFHPSNIHYHRMKLVENGILSHDPNKDTELEFHDIKSVDQRKNPYRITKFGIEVFELLVSLQSPSPIPIR